MPINTKNQIKKFAGNNPFFFLVILIIALIATGAAIFFFSRCYQLKKTSEDVQSQLKIAQSRLSQMQQDPALKSKQENQELLSAVGRLMVLPQDEEPTIATVADLEKLKDQPFFAQAQVGDKVLIYSQAGKAILYRPSENKIIELAPLNISTSTLPSSPNSQSQALTVEIRNGSGRSGVAASLQTRLQGNSQVSVTKIGNAAVVYPKTLLYVPEAQKASVGVTYLQQLTKAEIVASLPAGEASSSADVLLIVGQE